VALQARARRFHRDAARNLREEDGSISSGSRENVYAFLRTRGVGDEVAVVEHAANFRRVERIRLARSA